MFIKKLVGKKINRFLGNARGFRMAFKLVRKRIFEQTYKFCVITCFCFFLDIIKVYDEKVISFYFVFLIVTYINTHPLNLSIGEFRSSRRKLSYQYRLMCN